MASELLNRQSVSATGQASYETIQIQDAREQTCRNRRGVEMDEIGFVMDLIDVVSQGGTRQHKVRLLLWCCAFVSKTLETQESVGNRVLVRFVTRMKGSFLSQLSVSEPCNHGALSPGRSQEC